MIALNFALCLIYGEQMVFSLVAKLSAVFEAFGIE